MKSAKWDVVQGQGQAQTTTANAIVDIGLRFTIQVSLWTITLFSSVIEAHGAFWELIMLNSLGNLNLLAYSQVK